MYRFLTTFRNDKVGMELKKQKELGKLIPAPFSIETYILINQHKDITKRNAVLYQVFFDRPVHLRTGRRYHWLVTIAQSNFG